ncbi:uncharacterized protein LOC6617567 isoform X2 [Drosophila sechellia]|uniref:Hmr n=1 Tax=Drosophila sechellia TaxID=7238 RepID=Q86CW3_DROSE|nr:uncharacterized protein LOC6617567 isoform X2 [Drosophila sechellia]AAO84264.1 Hmr [Drosophila sechellia]
MEEEPVANENGCLIIVSDTIGQKTNGVDDDKAPNPFSRSTYPESGDGGILQRYMAERRLIALVRHQPLLYDTRHPKFHDVAQRERKWKKIAHRLATNMDNCMAAWSELRYKYQRHVHRLRAFHRSAIQSDQAALRPWRPCMQYEEEMRFLYPHVSRYPLIVDKAQPTEIIETEQVVERETLPDVELVEVPPVDIIDVDLEEDPTYNYRCSKLQRRLIEAVNAYPLLYDTTYTGYQNTRHRGLIWSAISNEVHDKATKLMKCWLKLQTRYEWELIHRPRHIGTSELCRLMDFMEPHIQRMRGTVCKASKYLQNGWHEPIEHFHSVVALINTMRNMPELVQLTEDSLYKKVKPPRYDEFWQKVGMEVMSGHERCEVTWLLLRAFYHELQAMRLSGYQLQDKWFFEGSISQALTHVASHSTARPALKRTANGAITLAGEPPAKTQALARMPLAIVYPPTTKGSSTSISNSASTATSIGPTFPNVRRSSGPAINNTSAAATNNVSSSVSTDQVHPTFVIPKITSATSVSSANKIPLKLSPNVRISSKAAGAMGTGVSPIVTTNQMAGLNAKPPEVRPQIPQIPGLQVKLHTKTQMPGIPQMAPVVPRTVIRTTTPTNPAQTQDRVYGGPVSPLGELLSGTLRPQNPSSIRSPAPQHTLPNFVPITTPSNITAKSNLPTPTAAPMVQIHQPGLKCAWDGKSNSVPFSKPMGSLSTTSSPAAAPIAPTGEPARAKTIPTKSKLPATTLGNPKKYQPIVPAAVPTATRMAKPAAEPATELLVPTPPTATGQTTRDIRKTALFPTSATQAASDKYATIRGTLASQAKSVGAALETVDMDNISAPVATPAKLPTVPKATTASQPAKEATAAGSASLGSQPENLPLGDITVCLHENATTGNVLQIWCCNQATRYNLNMVRTATLIREVMAVPQLHNDNPQLAAKCVEFWQAIAKKFHMPEEALRACWTFLASNMSVFPMIAPMSELMRPFKASVKVWEKSNRLFGKFDEIALKYQWLKHKDVLPAVIRFFANHEHLYCDLRKPRPGEYAQAPPQLTNLEKQEVWREARLKFPNLNHRDIWSMFKFAFRTYLDDLERGIENPWPHNWWQALEQLRFLVNVRYHPLEPYYYIVHNKMSEEVKRCSMYEALTSSDPTDKTKSAPTSLLTGLTKEPMPWETEEAKRLLTGKLNSVRSVATLTQITPAPAPASAPDAQPIPVPDGVSVPKETSESKPASNATVKSHKDKNISTARKRWTPARNVTCHNLSPIEAFELCKKLRSQPNTYEQASTLDKRTAWVRVSKELNATVTDCRLGLQYALREMRNLKIADPNNQCTMGHKYLHHMSEIYKQVKPNAQLTIRTPQQLNQLNKSLAKNTQEVKPQEFLPEINFSTCSPDLVVKNWTYAVGNLSTASQDALLGKMTELFSKYAKKVNPPPP